MLTVRAKAYKKEWTDKWRKTDVGIQYWKNHYRKPHVIQRIKKYKKTEFFKIGVLLANARKRAKVFGIPFSIGRDDIKIPKFCPIFGVELIWGDGQPKFNSPSFGLGLQRPHILSQTNALSRALRELGRELGNG